ncbi:EamA family transporter [Luteococcus sp. H138]|uniref:DMT family transporter n=1 Tax=unclassified Luteococcus TaxID=2639923 RepID=UPI00313D5040
MTRRPDQPGAPHGAVLALAGACLWGTTGTSQALLAGSPSPVAVGALRAGIAAIALLLVAVTTNRSGWVRTPTRHSTGWLVLAGLGVALYQLAFFAAVQQTGVGVGTLVTLACAPVSAGLLGWGLGGPRPTRRWALATLVALAGAAVLVTSAGTAHPINPLGIGLAIAAGCSFGGYTVAGHRVAQAGATGLNATAWIFAIAGLTLLHPLLGQDLGFVAQPRNLLVLGWLGLVATALAYLLYQRGMGSIDAATAATLALAEPLVANLLAVFALGEPFSWLMGVGVALVIAGLGLLSRA